ncbi:Hsp20/alpha crystallin family protein [Aestuariivita sp.]|uniref:Hsp20/alpha crystallin family protein n=1 Tax=Aestuariivita sp. TaxID=1872407 RepID=UPI002170E374|nr:Hsp20/alpha crystallin family protein [Aestuariivita sp.]MCE8009326.1 Hsp20/alpha crystallin family protein [Aestuariivita sp.]
MVEKSETGHFWPSLYEPFRTFGTRLADWLSPAAEASGDGQAYVIDMELPGVSEADIELMIEDGVVTIRGEKKTEQEKKGDTWYFSERQYGAFRRSFRLPADADADGVSARMKDGVLRVKVPRTAPQPSEKARKIEIAKG